MAWPVYSTRFLSYDADSGTQLYTVPAARVAVIKCIWSVSLSGNNSGVNVYCAGLMLWWHAYPVAGKNVITDAMGVARAGELITVQHGGAGLRTHVAGFLLTEPEGARAIEGEVQEWEGGEVEVPAPNWWFGAVVDPARG